MKLLISSLFVLFVLTSCENSQVNDNSTLVTYYQMMGEAQGTTYQITYSDKEDRDLKKEVDSLLIAYDLENSIYKPNSIISQFNTYDSMCFDMSSYHSNQEFKECFKIAKEVYHKTNGAFNPAIYPAVQYWGFYEKEQHSKPFSKKIHDSLHYYIAFDDNSFELVQNKVCKKNPKSKIDFNAIAQGHSVDVIAHYFDNLGLDNYMIELGGEIRCKGNNPDGEKWRIGIDKPVEHSNPGEAGFQFIAELNDVSLATSGNYRKFYEVDGQKFSHTIDPQTIKPVTHNLLSVTVITTNCADADAYATAFMVMGTKKSIDFIQSNPELNLEAYFVYDEDGELNTSMTGGFEQFIQP